MKTGARCLNRREIIVIDSNRLIDTWDTEELFITLWNTTDEEITVERGDVIAKITVILNSHGSYVTTPLQYILEEDVEGVPDITSPGDEIRAEDPLELDK